LFLVAFWLTAALAAAAEPKVTQVRPQDRARDPLLDVLATVHHVNQLGVQTGQLAKRKGVSARVRDYASHMIAEHGRADRELLEVLKTANGTLGNAVESGAEEKAALDQLSDAEGKSFDRLYAQAMRLSHARAIRAIESAPSLQNSLVGSYLRAFLPRLKEHARLIESLTLRVGD
jgi:putative membrane protein